MNSKSKNLVKNTAILSFGTICTKGIMFFMTPLFTRWLSQSDYGTFDLITTYITLLIPFVTLDCGEAAFRYLVEVKEDANDLMSHIISSAIFVTVGGLCISGLVFIGIYFFYKPVQSYLPSFFLLLVTETFYNFNVFVARGMKKLPIYTLANIFFVVSMSLFSVIMVKVMGLGLNGILLAYSFGYIVSILVTSTKIKIVKYTFPKAIDFQKLNEMLRYSLPLIPNAISWWIINVSNRTIVSMFFGTSANAIYAVANKIPNLCQTLFNVFHLSWQENAIETLNDDDRDKYYSNIMNKMVRILSSICLVILACNFLFFRLLFTKDYFDGYFQVPILVVSIVFSMMAQFIGGIYVARKESKKNGATTALTAGINVLVHLGTIKFIGLFAASISTLIAYIALFLIRYVDIRKNVRLVFNRTALTSLLIITYFFVCNYINVEWLNWVNLVFSIVYFIYVNYFYVEQILKKAKGKVKGK